MLWSLPSAAQTLPSPVWSKNVLYSQIVCPADASGCTRLFRVTVPAGYQSAEVLLTHYDMRFIGGTSPAKRLQLQLEPVAYDAVRGLFDFSARAVMEGVNVTSFQFQFEVMILLADERTAFEFVRVGGRGNASSFAQGVEVLEVADRTQKFMGFMLRGFDISSPTGVNPLAYSLDASSYEETWTETTLTATLNWECGLLGTFSNVTPVDCEMGLVAISHHCDIMSSASSKHFGPTRFSGGSSLVLDAGASAWYYGLQKARAQYYRTLGGLPLQSLSGGAVLQGNISTIEYLWDASLTSSTSPALFREVRMTEVQVMP